MQLLQQQLQQYVLTIAGLFTVLPVAMLGTTHGGTAASEPANCWARAAHAADGQTIETSGAPTNLVASAAQRESSPPINILRTTDTMDTRAWLQLTHLQGGWLRLGSSSRACLHSDVLVLA